MSIEDQKEYPLHRNWTLWYGKWNAPKKVMSFQTIADMWKLLNNIKAPTELPPQNDYHIFATGIAPEFEDENNKHGGSLVLEVSAHDANTYWLHTLLALVGNNFTYGDDITGLMINCKPKFARIQLWVRTTEHHERLKQTSEEWKKMLEVHYRQQVKFSSHHDIYILQQYAPKFVF